MRAILLNTRAFTAHTGKAVKEKWFRVADVLAQEAGDHVWLFASHHFWKIAEERCFVVRVSMAEGKREAFFHASESLSWKTLFESAPCLPIKTRSNPFAGHQIGGRLALLSPRDLLLTVGDQEFDGWNADRDLPQDKTASYGKTILIHPDKGTSEIYSLGHRNPQGLYVDAAHAVWLTEQGPQGGDELNVVLRGGNYGWPLATYGTDYGSLVWPLSRKQGEHDGFVIPLFSWIPSIAVSNVIGIEKDRFPLWKGDLLIASLRTKSLWRVRVRKSHVVYVERILIGRRILNILLEGEDGRILMWTDERSIMSLEPAAGTEKRGIAVFDDVPRMSQFGGRDGSGHRTESVRRGRPWGGLCRGLRLFGGSEGVRRHLDRPKTGRVSQGSPVGRSWNLDAGRRHCRSSGARQHHCLFEDAEIASSRTCDENPADGGS